MAKSKKKPVDAIAEITIRFFATEKEINGIEVEVEGWERLNAANIQAAFPKIQEAHENKRLKFYRELSVKEAKERADQEIAEALALEGAGDGGE